MTRKRILVVEDDEDLRYLWAETLEHHDYEVVGVDDGTTALAELRKFKPDLILLDFIMPRAKVDGVALLSRLSAEPAMKAIPILVISGLGDPLASKLMPDTANSFGIVGVLSKPLGLNALTEEVGKALRLKVGP
jgi:two-component system phosphate regulon response regulator PhoB